MLQLFRLFLALYLSQVGAEAFSWVHKVCVVGISAIRSCITGYRRASHEVCFTLSICTRIMSVFMMCMCMTDMLSSLATGKPFSYMSYDIKLMEQEAHVAGRPGSPYRLSPREPSKASPQPEPNNPARYSIPPGTHTHPYLYYTLFLSLFGSQTIVLWVQKVQEHDSGVMLREKSYLYDCC